MCLLRLPEKEKHYQSGPTYWKTNFSLSSRTDRESFSTRVFSPCGTKVRNCAGMLFQIREKLNTPTEWTIIAIERNGQIPSLQSTSSWFGSVNHYPWEFKHPAKNANELGPAWQNLAGKSHIHGHKENGLELFKSKRHFGEIKHPKTLNQPQWRTLHF